MDKYVDKYVDTVTQCTQCNNPPQNNKQSYRAPSGHGTDHPDQVYS